MAISWRWFHKSGPVLESFQLGGPLKKKKKVCVDGSVEAEQPVMDNDLFV